MTKELNKMHQEMENRMKEKFSHLESCAITHDMWTSIATEAYSAITIHYIDHDWTLKSLVLQTSKVDGSHTADAIAQDLQKYQDKWGFRDPIATTDNAAVENKAFKILGWPQIPCIGHNLNLAVKAALDIPEVSKVVAKGRNVVSYFNKSPTATSLLLEKQKLLLGKEFHGKKLVQDVSTRWNSTLDMLKRMLDLTPAVHATLLDVKLKNSSTRYLYTFDDQELVEALINLLSPFKDATEFMSSETVPTLPAVWPTMLKIKTSLEIKEDDPSMIKKMKQAALKNIEKRYVGKEDMLLLSSILHPRTKQLPYISEDERLRIHSLLIQKIKAILSMKAIANNDVRVKEEPENSSEPKLPEIKVEPGLDPDFEQPQIKKAKKSCMDWLDDVVVISEEPNVNVQPDIKAVEEFERYVTVKLCNQGFREIPEYFRDFPEYFRDFAKSLIWSVISRNP